MPAPFRIFGPRGGIRLAAANNAGVIGNATFDNYMDRLLKMIPGEVIGLYVVGSGIIPESAKNPNGRPVTLGVWALVCLAGLVAIRVYGTTAPPLPPQWKAVAFSAVAFVIWVYTLGGPFVLLPFYHPYQGSLLVLAYTFFVPIIYRG